MVNIPKTLDRSDALNHPGKTKVLQRYLTKAINDLYKVGCKYFAVPCNTVHHFIKDNMIPKGMTFIDMVRTTKDYIRKYHQGKNIIILETDGNKTMSQYDNVDGVKMHYPNDVLQQDIVDIIYDVKNGISKKQILSTFDRTLKKLSISNIYDPIFITACTGLSLFSNALKTKYNIVDPMDVLVYKLIKFSQP